MKTLAPRLEALEKALFQRPLALPEQKPHANQDFTPKSLQSDVLKRNDVKTLTGLGGTTLWRLENEGKFPSKIKLSNGRVGWRRTEVTDWIETRVAA